MPVGERFFVVPSKVSSARVQSSSRCLLSDRLPAAGMSTRERYVITHDTRKSMLGSTVSARSSSPATPAMQELDRNRFTLPPHALAGPRPPCRHSPLASPVCGRTARNVPEPVRSILQADVQWPGPNRAGIGPTRTGRGGEAMRTEAPGKAWHPIEGLPDDAHTCRRSIRSVSRRRAGRWGTGRCSGATPASRACSRAMASRSAPSTSPGRWIRRRWRSTGRTSSAHMRSRDGTEKAATLLDGLLRKHG